MQKLTVEGYNAYKRWLADIKIVCNDVDNRDHITSNIHIDTCKRQKDSVVKKQIQ